MFERFKKQKKDQKYEDGLENHTKKKRSSIFSVFKRRKPSEDSSTTEETPPTKVIQYKDESSPTTNHGEVEMTNEIKGETREKGHTYVLATGSNDSNQLVLNNSKKLIGLSHVPQFGRKTIQKIQGGFNFTIVLYTDGTVESFGTNRYHRRGTNRKTIRIRNEHNEKEMITDIACGDFHSLFLTQSGVVYGCGASMDHQLGSYVDNILAPIASNIKKIFTTSYGSFLVNNDNKLLASGLNKWGQLGLGHDQEVKEFALVDIPLMGEDEEFVKISGGVNHTLLLTSDHHVYVTGSNSYYQLVGCDTIKEFTPVILVTDKTEEIQFKDIACGNSHSLLLTTEQKVYVSGYNSSGQLCLKQRRIKVPTELGYTHISHVYAAGNYSILIHKGQEIWTFGNNEYGQLGRFSNESKLSPSHYLLPVELPLFHKENNSDTNITPTLGGVGMGLRHFMVFFNSTDPLVVKENPMIELPSTPLHPSSSRPDKSPSTTTHSASMTSFASPTFSTQKRYLETSNFKQIHEQMVPKTTFDKMKNEKESQIFILKEEVKTLNDRIKELEELIYRHEPYATPVQSLNNKKPSTTPWTSPPPQPPIYKRDITSKPQQDQSSSQSFSFSNNTPQKPRRFKLPTPRLTPRDEHDEAKPPNGTPAHVQIDLDSDGEAEEEETLMLPNRVPPPEEESLHGSASSYLSQMTPGRSRFSLDADPQLRFQLTPLSEKEKEQLYK